jgi:hypothetical protein
VDVVVLLERLERVTPFAAIFANITFLTCVYTPVNIQVAHSYKSFVTKVTFVRSDSLVDSFVVP